MKTKLKYTEYTQNMYLGKKLKLWSYFNNKRNKIVLKKIAEQIKETDSLLEVGGYDGFFINQLLLKIKTKPKEIIISDIYSERPLQKECIEHNIKIFQKREKKTKLNMVDGNIEYLKLTQKTDKIIVLETLEHVEYEEQAIKNIYKLLKKNGMVYVSIPVEFGVMFFLKDLGRRFIRKQEYHPINELIYGLFGQTKKIKRLPRQHKGYDFRTTKKMFKKNGFKKIYEKGYPFNNSYLAYGKVIVFKK